MQRFRALYASGRRQQSSMAAGDVPPAVVSFGARA